MNGEKALLEWLLARYPDTPKTRAKQWIVAGRVTVHGVVQRKPHQIIPDPGRGLELLERHAAGLACGRGWEIHARLTLLYLDTSLAIVNKGPGLVSVPAATSELSALSILADFLAGELKPQDRRIAGKSLPAALRKLRPLPIHRLDQYTSGVFCMAMNPDARRRLIEQVRARTMRREYIAFVEGRPAQRSGTWRHWLRLSSDQLRQEVVPAPKRAGADAHTTEAITHFEVLSEHALARGAIVTKLRLRLETGLKHQIRIQAAHSGLPLIGDRTYNPRYRQEAAEAPHIPFARQALHAESLTLDHPERPGRRMTWRGALPKDLRELEATLTRMATAAPRRV